MSASPPPVIGSRNLGASGLVFRMQLLDPLSRRAGGVTLLSAPARSGKTALLRTWIDFRHFPLTEIHPHALAAAAAAEAAALQDRVWGGRIACCDSSPHRHASADAHSSGHPIARSAQSGEDWSWCYVDNFAFVLAGP